MPKRNAERQQAWRQRQTGRIATIEAQAAELRAEVDILRADLAAALGAAERLASTAASSGLRRRCGRAAGDVHRAAEAADWLRRALEIFQRIGAAETARISAELHALTDARPAAQGS